MYNFFKTKIYRNKFISYIAILLLMAIILCGFTCSFFINSWIKDAQVQVSSSFDTAEKTMKSVIDKVNAYTQRIYSNTELLNDILCFSGNSVEEYLTRRLDYNEYNRQLVSFPRDLYQFLTNDGHPIIQVALRNGQYNNVLSFPKNGAMEVDFHVPISDQRFSKNIQNGFVYQQSLFNPYQVSEILGELYYLIDSSYIFENDLDYIPGNIVAIDSRKNIFPLKNSIDEDLLQQILQQNKANGTVSSNIINRIHYFVFTSNQTDYQLIYYCDNFEMITTHLVTVLFIIMVFIVIIIAAVLIMSYNLWYDLRFLTYIIEIINHVKVGDFAHLSHPKYRDDEYAMIAKELEDMSLKLEHYIQTEYSLKLRQREADMKALQSQINPHFLYNVLESIRSFALVNNDYKTANSISNLGGLYRAVVKTKNVLKMEEELEILKRYLGLMELRYPDNLFYQIDFEPEILTLNTIKFWIQPLAENFFVHGIDRNAEYNLIVVRGTIGENGEYVIEVIDNGFGVDIETLETLNQMFTSCPNIESNENDVSNSIGLRNVYTRLRFFYGDSLKMQMNNNSEGGAKISIVISKEAQAYVSNADS